MAEDDTKQKAIPEVEEPPLQRFAGPGTLCLGGGGRDKRSWPELVGVTSEEAERRIKEEKPGANVVVVPQDCFVTMDFRTERVRIFTDSQGRVAREPMIG